MTFNLTVRAVIDFTFPIKAANLEEAKDKFDQIQTETVLKSAENSDRVNFEITGATKKK